MAPRALTKTVPVEDEEITKVQAVARPAVVDQRSERETIRIARLNDNRLLAIARGEGLLGKNFQPVVLDAPAASPTLGVGEEADVTYGEWSLDAHDHAPPPVVPRVRMNAAELATLPLDHDAGFLLTHIDGRRTIAEIVDVSLLSPDDTLHAMAALVALGAVTLD